MQHFYAPYDCFYRTKHSTFSHTATTTFATQLWTDFWQRKTHGTDGRGGSKTDTWDGQIVMSGVGSEKRHVDVTVTAKHTHGIDGNKQDQQSKIQKAHATKENDTYVTWTGKTT